jgi:hypothetical protein
MKIHIKNNSMSEYKHKYSAELRARMRWKGVERM